MAGKLEVTKPIFRLLFYIDKALPTRHVDCGHTRTQLRQRIPPGKRLPILPPPLDGPRDCGPARKKAQQIKDKGQGYLSTTVVSPARGPRIPPDPNTHRPPEQRQHQRQHQHQYPCPPYSEQQQQKPAVDAWYPLVPVGHRRCGRVL